VKNLCEFCGENKPQRHEEHRECHREKKKNDREKKEKPL
jgi:hypothetical protein